MEANYVLIAKSDLLSFFEDVLDDKIVSLSSLVHKKKVTNNIISKAEAKKLVGRARVESGEKNGFLKPFQMGLSGRTYYKRPEFELYVQGVNTRKEANRTKQKVY